MALNVFGWLRNQARQAVLGGISDALTEVATDAQPADLEQLRKMLADGGGAKQLTAAAPVAEEAEAEPVAAGRKKKQTT